jgi:hypothetical protein
MENQDWQEIVDALVDAKRCLASAWQILDGTDGAASGVGPALKRCSCEYRRDICHRAREHL